MILTLLIVILVVNILGFVLWFMVMGKQESRMTAEFQSFRAEHADSSRMGRQELQQTMHAQSQTNLQTLSQISQQQQLVLGNLVTQIEQMRAIVEQKLTTLQEDNHKKLEQMRSTVEEKLQSTLEKRLGESFRQVSDRLEQVHKGLGEMQALANGVGDLKKVLVNVKTRGVMGEIQLGNILEQILAPEQFAANVAINPNNQERVEFAVKLPAHDEQQEVIYLPIDAKFPVEDYQRLIQAQEDGDKDRELEALKGLVSRIKQEARKIRDKYIQPPYTTDFAILFLPFEGLYAEVLRRPGLWEELQRDCRVVITGPSTLAALLNSLQMGFRTLAIQKRSSEVWQLLGAVKTKFGAFAQLLAKAQKKIEEAGRSIESAGVSTRQIEKKLAKVQELELSEAGQLISLEHEHFERESDQD
jgi:DNA recombination protein RmuC